MQSYFNFFTTINLMALNFLVISTNAVAGYLLKALDDKIDISKEKRKSLFIYSIAIGVLLSFFAYNFPDVALGIILGNAFARKIDSKEHILHSVIVLVAALFNYIAINPFVFLVCLVASLIDEYEGKIRLVVPLALIILLFLNGFSDYFINSFLAMVSFDLAYKIRAGSKLLKF